MSRSKIRDHLSAPSLKIAGFQLWVHGREYPDAEFAYDQDWLNVTAHCGAKGASVWVNGPVLQSWDIAQFARQCEQLRTTLSGSAQLGAAEPNLFAKITAVDRHGHLDLVVELTPDHLTQEHSFRFDGLDQSYLLDVETECNTILRMYPTVLTPRGDA